MRLLDEIFYIFYKVRQKIRLKDFEDDDGWSQFVIPLGIWFPAIAFLLTAYAFIFITLGVGDLLSLSFIRKDIFLLIVTSILVLLIFRYSHRDYYKAMISKLKMDDKIISRRIGRLLATLLILEITMVIPILIKANSSEKRINKEEIFKNENTRPIPFHWSNNSGSLYK